MSRNIRRTIFALFFLSGISGLIYEVVWMRQLSLIFGVSVYAASAVLTAYMAGLALGSYTFGHWIDRLADRRPEAPQADSWAAWGPRVLRAYGSLQVGIGLAALLLPLPLSGLTDLYIWIARHLSLSFYAFSLIRFVLSFPLLIVPTTLMGATLPVLSRLVVRGQEGVGLEVGRLYAVNTLGAVLGASATGLFLIRLLGVAHTTRLGVGINLLVGAVAWGMSRGVPLGEEQERRGKRGGEREGRGKKGEGGEKRKIRRYPSRVVRLVLMGFALSGFVSLGYEVLWSRILTIHSSNAIYSFSIILTIFLAGLAFGSWIAARRVDRGERLVSAFGLLELGIGLSAILFLFLFARLPTISLRVREALGPGRAPFSAVVFEYVIALVTIFVPALLIGAVFPVVSTVCTRGAKRIGGAIGDIYALNTLGTILGSFLAGFALIPLLGLQRSVILLAMINLFIGSAALLFDPRAEAEPQPVPFRQYGPIALSVILAAAMVSSLPQGIYLGFREGSGEHLIFYKEGVDSTVAVFHVKDEDFKVSFVNGRMEVPTDELSMQTFHLLGQLPLLLHPDPQEVLVLSFGNGIVSGSIARHREVQHIDAVDLSSEMIEASRKYTEENANVLDDPRLRIIIEDARNYLLRTDKRYDVITADATHPMNSCSWALFTRQFYQLNRARLKPGGIMIQWLPLHDLALGDYKRIVKTFKSIFPHTTLWQVGNPYSTHTLLLGTPEQLSLDLRAIDAKLHGGEISPLLGKAEDLPAHFLMDAEAIDLYTAGVEVVTDDNAYFMPKEDVRIILASFALHRVDAPLRG